MNNTTNSQDKKEISEWKKYYGIDFEVLRRAHVKSCKLLNKKYDKRINYELYRNKDYYIKSIVCDYVIKYDKDRRLYSLELAIKVVDILVQDSEKGMF